MKPAAVSAGLGSDTILVRIIAVPSELLTGIPLIATAGGTLKTLMVLLSVPVSPVPVALKVTTYVPSSSGLKVRLAADPVEYEVVVPFLVLVTVQA